MYNTYTNRVDYSSIIDFCHLPKQDFLLTFSMIESISIPDKMVSWSWMDSKSYISCRLNGFRCLIINIGRIESQISWSWLTISRFGEVPLFHVQITLSCMTFLCFIKFIFSYNQYKKRPVSDISNGGPASFVLIC